MTQKNHIKDITRGSQVFLHKLRMMMQVLNKVLLCTLPLVLIGSFFCFIETTDKDTRYIGKKWLIAQFHLILQRKICATTLCIA